MVIYVGVFRTVKEMKTYTAYIVNFTICDLCLSLTMGVLVRPEPIFPLDGAKVTGFLQYFGSYAGYISIVLIVVFLSLCLSAQCHCIIYRMLVLMENRFYFNSFKTIYMWIFAYFCNAVCIFGICYVVSNMLYRPEVVPTIITQAITAKRLQIDIGDISFSKYIYFNRSSPYTVGFAIVAVVSYVVVEVISFGCIFSIFKTLQVKRQNYSKVTYRMHIQLAMALGAQVLVPILFVILPVLYLVWSGMKDGEIGYVQGMLCIISVDIYGGVSSLLTLYFIKPYRQFYIMSFIDILHMFTSRRFNTQRLTWANRISTITT